MACIIGYRPVSMYILLRPVSVYFRFDNTLYHNGLFFFRQSAVFIPTFMGLRGMAELPVESMKTGGILWFQDLTQADPYYGLAALTSLTLATIVRVSDPRFLSLQ